MNKATRSKQYYQEHKESIKKQQKQYVLSHREEKNKRQRQYDLKYREEKSERGRQRYQRRKLSVRNSMLVRTYGITLKEYNKMFADQAGKCAICERHQSEFKKALCVDHNHNIGKVRGLLCDPCNQALGLLQENANLCHKAGDYIKKYESIQDNAN